MLYARTVVEHPGGGAGSILPSIAGGELRDARSAEQGERYTAELLVDQVLADSFPASDPPSWTLAVARPMPAGRVSEPAPRDVDAPAGGSAVVVETEVIDVPHVQHGTQSFLLVLKALVGIAGMALTVAVAILLIGLPVALLIRGIARAMGWL